MLIIIWGSTGKHEPVSRGEFHCPSCDSRKHYRHIEVKRYFTIYFIPLFPLETAGEYIECISCMGTFKTEVLQYDPEADHRKVRAEFEAAVLRTMVHLMIVDGHIDPSEVDAIRHFYGHLVGRDIMEDELRSEAVAISASKQTVRDYLASVAPHLNEHGKETVVRAACMVAVADGHVQDEELAMLIQLARTLDVSEAHFKGIMMSVQGSVRD